MGIFFENFSLAIIFRTLVSSIFFFVILHEGVHLGYYKLRGHDAKFCLRIKGNIRDWEVPKPNPYVVTPEQILTNGEVKVGYILPLILLTPVFIVAILISSERVVDLFLLFALSQNIAGSFIDVRDFYSAVSRDSEARI